MYILNSFEPLDRCYGEYESLEELRADVRKMQEYNICTKGNVVHKATGGIVWEF